MTIVRTIVAAPFWGIGIALMSVGMLFLAAGQIIQDDEVVAVKTAAET